MSASIIDGKAIAADIDARAKHTAEALARIAGRKPGLAVVLIGDDPASDVYVRNKGRRAEAASMRSIEIRKPASTSQAEVIAIVERLNTDPSVDGILVQMPLPEHIDSGKVIAAIDPDKDVDGLTPVSAGRLLLGQPGLRPCTPAGCVILAERAMGKLDGKSVVVVGRSILVGKPAALLFLEKNCTVTIAHSRTQDLPALCRGADILVAAVGRPEMIEGGWIKPGACVLDVGINRVPAPEKGEGGTRLVGDVDFETAKEIAGSITPVPGGVGPMTIALLLRNTVQAMARREGVDISGVPARPDQM
ncbi:bifunctional methylenetetrahydrofolate dehydrogenase/methenyltetrahydrofolate cyclohydrolase FolD [Hyphobacterium sp. SN044]|uniref:bifunctional methylenetetrahydrofolate dehydrogenase/methenyltetrahydrofolate cyclohydrolase FolD n=1 Tax=Hyphobacterium sp. SN044 TaxID=2912575 RepID=UPI001F01F935|nr:bifunctional methylenetetrahydrofolate dehydrogenase/methenyltetrahydrofolate cyclohydrolase FolD [Hyphobacterium sp. SN044]MCF8880430.1 bifunctional methylenetetrahydrofolate dehydrogenase/methenyltetrahydrofolate cyclohydrolase FolD [Hyphobacterium sp. SN044]